MKCILISIILCLLLIGCANPIIIERNITVERIVYNNTIEYIDNTIPCNVTCPEPEINSTVYDRQYVLGLIRQLKHYEDQQSIYFNDSECIWELNKSNIELKECEDVMCREWNSSWC